MSSADHFTVGDSVIDVNYDIHELIYMHWKAVKINEPIGKVTNKDIKDLVSGNVTLDEMKLMLDSNLRRSSSRPRNAVSRLRGASVVSNRSRSQSGTPAPAETSENKKEKKKPPKKKTGNKKEDKLPTTCSYCHGCYLRVINYGRMDKKNVLECRNRNCLATIALTDLPEGTVLKEPPESPENYGWYLRSLTDVYYPSKQTLERHREEAAKFEEELDFVPETLYNENGEIMVRVPGQVELAKLM